MPSYKTTHKRHYETLACLLDSDGNASPYLQRSSIIKALENIGFTVVATAKQTVVRDPETSTEATSFALHRSLHQRRYKDFAQDIQAGIPTFALSNVK